MKRSAVLSVFVVILTVPPSHAQAPPVCLPEITAPVIDGIVATDPFHLHGGIPNADIGWATAPYQVFSVVAGGGAVGTLKTAVFAGTTLSGGKPDHLYLGVHVENADQFSSADSVTLYFDSDHNGTFDFALQFGVGPVSGAVSSGSNNGQLPTTTALYLFSGGAWQTATIPPETQVKARTAWNFTGGAGNGIWELEVDVNLTALGVPTSASGFGFGAKLYVVPVLVSPVPFSWPAALSTDANPNDAAPGTDTTPIIAANLDNRSIRPGGTACVGDVQVYSVKSHSRGTDDLFYLPKDTDFSGANLPAQFQTVMSAQAIYVNTADIANTSPTGGTNSGFVHLRLMPWGAGPVDTVDLGSFPVGIQQFGTPSSPPVSVSWPLTTADWNPHKNAFLTLSNHACLKATLESFTQNIVNANDEVQVNLQYTTMSTHRDKFLIHAPGAPGGPKENYMLRMRWSNLPTSKINDPDKPESCWRRLCDWLHHRTPWQGKLIDPQKLGLKPLGHGYYGLQLSPGQEVVAEVELSGAGMPVPSRAIHVPPTAGGTVSTPSSGTAAVTVPVPAGGMVTIVAKGMIGVLSGQYTGANAEMNNANGFPAQQLDRQQFLLASKTAPAWQFAGALIGAFKPDFSDSFFIGTEGTFYATPGATTLYLAVNDVAGGYGDNTGAGFDLSVVATPPTTLPTRLSFPAVPALNLPGAPQAAANLPMLNIDVMKVDNVHKATIPIGYVGYAIYATHNGNAGRTAAAAGAK